MIYGSELSCEVSARGSDEIDSWAEKLSVGRSQSARSGGFIKHWRVKRSSRRIVVGFHAVGVHWHRDRAIIECTQTEMNRRKFCDNGVWAMIMVREFFGQSFAILRCIDPYFRPDVKCNGCSVFVVLELHFLLCKLDIGCNDYLRFL